MRIRLVALVGLAAAVLLTGCSAVVDGAGSTGLQAGGPSSFPSSSPPSAPGQSGPAPSGAPAVAAPTSCPHVRYPTAKISFTCITSGMTASVADGVWPLQESRTVEKKTQWTVDEGAGLVGPAGPHTLAEITQGARTLMVDEAQSYGTSPTLTTVSNRDTRVGGVAAHVLQTTITLNPQWAKKVGTKVRSEHLWLVALQVDPNDITLWYVSVPDLVSSLWARVPAIIDSIKVS